MNKIFDKHTIDKLNNFEVGLPQDDWDKLLSKMEQDKKRIIVPIWIRYAAAVVLLLTVGGTIGYNYMKDSKTIVAEQISNQKEMPEETQNSDNSLCPKDAEQPTYNRNQEINPAEEPTHNNSYQNRHLDTGNATTKNRVTPSPLADDSPIDNNDNKKAIEQQKATNKKENNTQTTIEQAKKLMEEQNREAVRRLSNGEREKEAKKQKNRLKNRDSYKRGLFASADASVSALHHGTEPKYGPQKRMMFSPNYGFARASTYIRTNHNLPITVGLNVGIPIAKKLYINTGLQYSYVSSKTSYFDSQTNKIISEDNQILHYLGIPVRLSYHFLNKSVFGMYMSAGTAIEKGIKEVHVFKQYEPNGEPQSRKTKNISGFQYSLNASIGVSFKLYRGLNLYLEPGVSWHIPSKKYPQPTNKRTLYPFFIDITGGVRWNF